MIIPTTETTYTTVCMPADWVCMKCGDTLGDHNGDGCEFQREVHDFVAMLRIRNEERWIGEVIESILPLCSRVFILDDHSTDQTAEICSQYEAVSIIPSRFNKLNEARDKSFLFDTLYAQCAPRWVLCIDGDEVLEKAGPKIIREKCAEDVHQMSYSLQIAYLWNSPDTVRTDRIYGDFWRPSLFRPFHPNPDNPDHIKLLSELRFMATPFGKSVNGNTPNLHCSSVPQRFLHGVKRCPAKLKHYGYMYRSQRVQKLDYYTSIDWLNEAEGLYSHMVQGDDVTISELPKTQDLLRRGVIRQADIDRMLNAPATARLLHAGPIEVTPFSG